MQQQEVRPSQELAVGLWRGRVVAGDATPEENDAERAWPPLISLMGRVDPPPRKR
jgi:hypothetical protein